MSAFVVPIDNGATTLPMGREAPSYGGRHQELCACKTYAKMSLPPAACGMFNRLYKRFAPGRTALCLERLAIYARVPPAVRR